VFLSRCEVAQDLAAIGAKHDAELVATRRDFIDAAREIVAVSLLEPSGRGVQPSAGDRPGRWPSASRAERCRFAWRKRA
jgi:hypothetical protein